MFKCCFGRNFYQPAEQEAPEFSPPLPLASHDLRKAHVNLFKKAVGIATGAAIPIETDLIHPAKSLSWIMAVAFWKKKQKQFFCITDLFENPVLSSFSIQFIRNHKDIDNLHWMISDDWPLFLIFCHFYIMVAGVTSCSSAKQLQNSFLVDGQIGYG